MQLSNSLGVRYSNDPERYLGLPNLVGCSKKLAFQTLKDKIKNKIYGWGTRFLSQSGREVFVNFVLQAIPLYSMMCFLLPKTFCHDLKALIARSWWQKGHDRQGIHWCTWRKLCDPKDSGGLGFQSMQHFNIALLMKHG